MRSVGSIMDMAGTDAARARMPGAMYFEWVGMTPPSTAPTFSLEGSPRKVVSRRNRSGKKFRNSSGGGLAGDVGQRIAQAARGLAVDLSDAGLGHAQDGPDLLQVQVVAVIQRQHLLHLVGQVPDAGDETLGHLVARRLLERNGDRVVARALQQVRTGVVDAHHRRTGQLLLARVQLVPAHTQALRDLLLVRRAPQLRLQLAGGVPQLVGQPAHVARQRVARAQIVEHGAADAELGERLEAIHALRIEALGRLEQPDDARRDQVVDLDVRGKAAGQATGHLLDVGKELRGVRVAASQQLGAGELLRLLDDLLAGLLAVHRRPNRLRRVRLLPLRGRHGITFSTCRATKMNASRPREWRALAAPSKRTVNRMAIAAGRRRRPNAGGEFMTLRS